MRLATMQGRRAAAEPRRPIGFSNMILFGKKYGNKIPFYFLKSIYIFSIHYIKW